MKSLWMARNRRGKREAPRLSLFPFLAVLICTMGALVLLLLSVTRQARLQAAREAATKDAEKQTKIAADMEMVQWRVDQLKSSRKQTAAQLAEARLMLGHIEDHGRRLRDQFADLSAQAKTAAAEGLKPGRFAAPGEDELRQLEGQIAEAQERLALSQQSAANRPRSYAIVPYEGPNRTRRRPIYIECRSDAVVLQPENIVFGEADFDEPLGPGNPLAAAVRAAREQMLMERNLDPQNAGEPYPLLLVRPDGILAYDCALAAMKSWGSDFGYELINADWQLKYPPADPNVGRAVAQAVELARQEHARLVAAAPSKYGKRPSSGLYRSSLADDGGQSGGGDAASPGFYSSKPADRYGQQYAGGGPGDGSSSGSNGPSSRNASGGGSGHGRGGFGSGGALAQGGDGGSGDSDGVENSIAKADEDFKNNNPYDAMAFPAGAGSGGGVPGGMAHGGGPGGAYPGGYGSAGAPGGVPGAFTGAPGGGGAPGGVGGLSGGNGGALGGMGGYASGMGGGPGGSNGGPGSVASGGPGLGVAGGGYGSGGSPYGSAAGGAGDGSMTGDGLGGGPAGSPGTASGGAPAIYTPMFGQQGAPGTGEAPAQRVGDGTGGNGGAPAQWVGGAPGTAQPGVPSNGQAAYQGNGQPAYPANGQPAYPANGQPGGSATAAAVQRPDGYIIGRPNDGSANPQPAQRPEATTGVAMVPAGPLRPGEYRPPDNTPPPKADPDKEKKKKNPYENIDPDRSQADWALRNARSHAAAISRPVHVDCYADRLVIAPEQPGGQPHVIVCNSNSRRNADKFVAVMWEVMDSWGMAGKEMYWRPVLDFYVAPGGEPRMVDMTRALDGSGLVIERKQ